MIKIALGMSGGVDSSVAIHLLQQEGFEVIGLHLKLVKTQGRDQNSTEDAKRIADHFKIDLHVIHAEDLFEQEVTAPFIDAYRKGLTPNPCIQCNKKIKFDYLWNLAQTYGCSHLATGHYAQILNKNNRIGLYRAIDQIKDQSYFLYGINQSILEFLRFPIGKYHKKEIREIASKLKLPVYNKSDSQEICFIPNDDYISWLKNNASHLSQHGQFINLEQQVLGEHQGIWRYTIGQRKGLGLALGYPAYVTHINPEDNSITIGQDKDLWSDFLIAEEINWLTDPYLLQQGEGIVRIRSRDQGSLACWKLIGEHLEVRFDKPVRAITSGQSIVFYQNDYICGGGIIK